MAWRVISLLWKAERLVRRWSAWMCEVSCHRYPLMRSAFRPKILPDARTLSGVTRREKAGEQW
jgi:hypothetical protein